MVYVNTPFHALSCSTENRPTPCRSSSPFFSPVLTSTRKSTPNSLVRLFTLIYLYFLVPSEPLFLVLIPAKPQLIFLMSCPLCSVSGRGRRTFRPKVASQNSPEENATVRKYWQKSTSLQINTPPHTCSGPLKIIERDYISITLYIFVCFFREKILHTMPSILQKGDDHPTVQYLLYCTR